MSGDGPKSRAERLRAAEGLLDQLDNWLLLLGGAFPGTKVGAEEQRAKIREVLGPPAEWGKAREEGDADPGPEERACRVMLGDDLDKDSPRVEELLDAAMDKDRREAKISEDVAWIRKGIQDIWRVTNKDETLERIITGRSLSDVPESLIKASELESAEDPPPPPPPPPPPRKSPRGF